MSDDNLPNMGCIVYVIDDDRAMLEAVEALLDSVGLTVKSFSAASTFLSSELPEVPSCVVLDVRLKGESGLEVQERLFKTLGLPVVIMTAHGDIPMSVQAMKSGAVDFLSKPFRGQDMIEAVTRAIARDRERRVQRNSIARLQKLYESLTPRERLVMGMVAHGLLNKQIALDLNVSEVTVKLHRGQAMKKMESPSIADFVLKASALGLVRKDFTEDDQSE
jgi:FixJ family two-component response regulator